MTKTFIGIFNGRSEFEDIDKIDLSETEDFRKLRHDISWIGKGGVTGNHYGCYRMSGIRVITEKLYNELLKDNNTAELQRRLLLL